MKYFFLSLVFINIYASKDKLDEMMLEEKVGQVFMTSFQGEELNADVKKLIQTTKIGGIIYYGWANGLQNPIQVQNLSNSLQTYTKEHTHIPLFIAVDQEGGVVTRLRNGFTEFPGNDVLGQINDCQLTYQVAYSRGKELQAVGVNVNFAPVVDIKDVLLPAKMQPRSFGGDKNTVTHLGSATVQGYVDSGIIPCLKHFPGHGSAKVDSHIQLPIVDKSYEELCDFELIPFEKISKKTPMIMTAHILFPQIDPQNCATLSSFFCDQILRKKWGYSGVLISDCLVMKGVLQDLDSLNETILQAFEAGCDILLLGGRQLQQEEQNESNIDIVIKAYYAFIEAVKSGRISQSRLDASVKRILQLKEDFGLFNLLLPDSSHLQSTLQKKEHIDLAKKLDQITLSLYQKISE